MRLITLALLSAASLAAQLSPLDTSVSPCTDFYRYACSIWREKNPLPPDQPVWDRFDELNDRNLATLRGIVEKAGSDKIGIHYAACMDEKTIDAKGLAPLKPYLDHINALANTQEIAALVARLHRAGIGTMFSFYSGQDFKNSSQVIAQADQGGLGLPDRDYYFTDDAKSKDTREKYVAHVANVFRLAGDLPDKAQQRAGIVMRIETALAKGALDKVSRREPSKIYHRFTAAQIKTLAPRYRWDDYLAGVAAPPIRILNVAVPDFFKQLQTLLGETSLDDWKTYFTWHLLRSKSGLLPAPFVNESFAFYGLYLTGAKELRPRWKRCVERTDNDLGEALGKAYVALTFGADGKERTLELVRRLERAMETDIRGLDWMSQPTKARALRKLHAITNKIGYPDKWRDYSTLEIKPGDALGNSIRAAEFEFRRDLSKIGKPVDRGEWQMTPPTVNAYYDPQMNNINFPAGILQPPFFDKRTDDPVNFGAIGAAIGHELTHGFDDEGRQFDEKGNLRNWWTPQDLKAFEERVQCLVDQYSSYIATDDVKLNGKLTLGENTADNGGVRISLMALGELLAGKSPAPIDGLTAQQRYFIGYAQIWCQNSTEEYARLQALTNPHSLGPQRVIGVVSNMPEFKQAFGCKAGDPMVREKACRVW